MNIHIKQVANGFSVIISEKIFVFESLPSMQIWMSRLLDEEYTHPSAQEAMDQLTDRPLFASHRVEL